MSMAVRRVHLLGERLTVDRSDARCTPHVHRLVSLARSRFFARSVALLITGCRPMHRHGATWCSDFAMPGMRRHYACAPRTLLGTDEQPDPLCPSTTTSRSSAGT